MLKKKNSLPILNSVSDGSTDPILSIGSRGLEKKMRPVLNSISDTDNPSNIIQSAMSYAVDPNLNPIISIIQSDPIVQSMDPIPQSINPTLQSVDPVQQIRPALSSVLDIKVSPSIEPIELSDYDKRIRPALTSVNTHSNQLSAESNYDLESEFKTQPQLRPIGIDYELNELDELDELDESDPRINSRSINKNRPVLKPLTLLNPESKHRIEHPKIIKEIPLLQPVSQLDLPQPIQLDPHIPTITPVTDPIIRTPIPPNTRPTIRYHPQTIIPPVGTTASTLSSGAYTYNRIGQKSRQSLQPDQSTRPATTGATNAPINRFTRTRPIGF